MQWMNNGERANNEDGSNSTLLHSHSCAIYDYDGRDDEEYCGIIRSLPSKNGPSLGILRLPPLMLFKNPA